MSFVLVSLIVMNLMALQKNTLMPPHLIDGFDARDPMVLRVGDMQRSVDFYTKTMGMNLLRTTDRPEQKYSLAFVGYGPESEQAVIELTYNYGVDRYDLGGGYGHIAVEDLVEGVLDLLVEVAGAIGLGVAVGSFAEAAGDGGVGACPVVGGKIHMKFRFPGSIAGSTRTIVERAL